jgi:hypothetical protein
VTVEHRPRDQVDVGGERVVVGQVEREVEAVEPAVGVVREDARDPPGEVGEQRLVVALAPGLGVAPRGVAALAQDVRPAVVDQRLQWGWTRLAPAGRRKFTLTEPTVASVASVTARTYSTATSSNPSRGLWRRAVWVSRSNSTTPAGRGVGTCSSGRARGFSSGRADGWA